MSSLARALLAELDADALAELAGRLAPYLPQSQAAEDCWMDSAAAADYLGMSKAALHRLTAARSIPFEQDQPGAKCWFQRSALDAWRRSGGLRALPCRSLDA